MSTKLEIQTIEGGRLEWIAIMSSTKDRKVVTYGECLLAGFNYSQFKKLKPKLRIVDGKGLVIGAWQADGYTPAVSAP